MIADRELWKLMHKPEPIKPTPQKWGLIVFVGYVLMDSVFLETFGQGFIGVMIDMVSLGKWW